MASVGKSFLIFNKVSNWSMLLSGAVLFLFLTLGTSSAASSGGDICQWHSQCKGNFMCYAGKCVDAGMSEERSDYELKLYIIIPLCVFVPFLFFVTILVSTSIWDTIKLRNKYGFVINAKSLGGEPRTYLVVTGPGATAGPSSSSGYLQNGQVNEGFGQRVVGNVTMGTTMNGQIVYAHPSPNPSAPPPPYTENYTNTYNNGYVTSKNQ